MPDQPDQPTTPQPEYLVLSWASTVIGIIGYILAWVPAVNTLCMIGAAFGAVFGFVAMSGRRKLASGLSAINCLLVVVLIVLVQNGTLKGPGGTPATVGATGNSATTADPRRPGEQTLTWGQRYTWPHGVAIEVDTPEECTPSGLARPKEIRRAVRFTITLVNGSTATLTSATLLYSAEAQFAGTRAETISDFGGGCQTHTPGPATVPPGNTYTFTEAYAVTTGIGEMRLVFRPGANAPTAAFLGQA